MSDRYEPPWWRSPGGLVLCGFLVVGGFFLLTQHTAHVFGVLPYLLVLACPFMHMFHHHGDRGHRHHAGPDSGTPQGDDAKHREMSSP